MKSKWFEFKNEVMTLRKKGVSMTLIERKFGIPRSTLSDWFKSVVLTDEQQSRLTQNSRDGWAKARIKAVESHHAQKTLRLLNAKQAAIETLEKIELTSEVLDLAFAMLYLGEGAKSNATYICAWTKIVTS